MLRQNLQLLDDELVNLALQKWVTSLQGVSLNSDDLVTHKEVETDYHIQPVTLGAKLPNLDNIHEVLAIAEGEAYR